VCVRNSGEVTTTLQTYALMSHQKLPASGLSGLLLRVECLVVINVIFCVNMSLTFGGHLWFRLC